MTNTKLIGRLVKKFSIKVNDLVRYMEICKATIYNYCNMEEYSQIPNDKQYKISYLFGKENEDDLWLLLDENDKGTLYEYSLRFSWILTERVASLKPIVADINYPVETIFKDLTTVVQLSKKIALEKVYEILLKMANLAVENFCDYLDVYNIYLEGRKN